MALDHTALLAVFCTVYAYTTMTHWQPRVTATQAGLIYATEPVFASAWALFLPGWFSGFAGIAYANEHLTWQLFAGGRPHPRRKPPPHRPPRPARPRRPAGDDITNNQSLVTDPPSLRASR